MFTIENGTGNTLFVGSYQFPAGVTKKGKLPKAVLETLLLIPGISVEQDEAEGKTSASPNGEKAKRTTQKADKKESL